MRASRAYERDAKRQGKAKETESVMALAKMNGGEMSSSSLMCGKCGKVMKTPQGLMQHKKENSVCAPIEK